MTITRFIARSSLAPIFLIGGLDALRHPKPPAQGAEVVTGPISKALGITDDPVKLVRINGGMQLAAGALLVLGWAPRLASTVLVAGLVPTTLADHRFWEEKDPVLRAQQRTAFLKNCAIGGGLLLGMLDKNGAPSWRWRAGKAGHKFSGSAAELSHRTAETASQLTTSISEAITDAADIVGHKLGL